MSPHLRAELADWRRGGDVVDRTCLALFGITLDTVKRIEAGEVEPDDEVHELIVGHLSRIAEQRTRSLGPAIEHAASPTLPGRRITVPLLHGSPVPGVFALCGLTAVRLQEAR